ncbi:MAG: N-6 DNA methylase [Bacilli bacterium]
MLGAFYDQFTKYSASDQQSLGIVLTPHHVAQFMSDLLEINENDVVLDTCCGSSSLLLTAGGKAKQSIGVELNSRMTAISLANMIIKDLPTYIWLGNSFDDEIREEIKTYKPTKLIINPPYS